MNKPNPTQRTYKSLDDAYRFFNERLFDGRLPNCLITMQRSKKSYGYFAGGRFGTTDGKEVTDEIALDPSHFRSRTTEQSLSTLVHEMVHLEQHHFGKPPRVGYDNRRNVLDHVYGHGSDLKLPNDEAFSCIQSYVLRVCVDIGKSGGDTVDWFIPAFTPVHAHTLGLRRSVTTDPCADRPSSYLSAFNRNLSGHSHAKCELVFSILLNRYVLEHGVDGFYQLLFTPGCPRGSDFGRLEGIHLLDDLPWSFDGLGRIEKPFSAYADHTTVGRARHSSRRDKFLKDRLRAWLFDSGKDKAVDEVFLEPSKATPEGVDHPIYDDVGHELERGSTFEESVISPQDLRDALFGIRAKPSSYLQWSPAPEISDVVPPSEAREGRANFAGSPSVISTASERKLDQDDDFAIFSHSLRDVFFGQPRAPLLTTPGARKRFPIGRNARPPAQPASVPRKPSPIKIGYHCDMNGQNVGGPLLSNTDRHIVLFGLNGAGKSGRFLIELLMTMTGRSAIIFDLKGELAYQTAEERQHYSDVKIINPFGVLGIPSDGYNPLLVLDPQGPKFYEAAAAIGDALIEIESGAGQYWSESAQGLLVALIMYEVITARAESRPPSLFKVRKMLTETDEYAPDDRARERPIKGLSVTVKHMIVSGNEAIASLAGCFVRSGGKSELASIQSTASTETEWMLSDAMQKDMQKQGTDFRQLPKRPTTIYIVMDPEGNRSHASVEPCSHCIGPQRTFYAWADDHTFCPR